MGGIKTHTGNIGKTNLKQYAPNRKIHRYNDLVEVYVKGALILRIAETCGPLCSSAGKDGQTISQKRPQSI